MIQHPSPESRGTKPKSPPRKVRYASRYLPKPRPNLRTTLATLQIPRKQRHPALRYRNGPDTGNGIEAILRGSKGCYRLAWCSDEPDTGGGIETTKDMEVKYVHPSFHRSRTNFPRHTEATEEIARGVAERAEDWDFDPNAPGNRLRIWSYEPELEGYVRLILLQDGGLFNGFLDGEHEIERRREGWRSATTRTQMRCTRRFGASRGPGSANVSPAKNSRRGFSSLPTRMGSFTAWTSSIMHWSG